MSSLNDPRVLFAAERTLLAWNRTSISLMAFGFVVERFGLFLEIANRQEATLFQRHISFFVGVSFILLGAMAALYAAWQHKKILKTLHSEEVPMGYRVAAGMAVSIVLGVLGLILGLYLIRSF